MGEFEPAPADTRLGQLQRGHGRGFLAALADTAAARDEVLTALWDCEEGAAAAAVVALPTLDADARARVAELATDPLANETLRGAASRRLAAS